LNKHLTNFEKTEQNEQNGPQILFNLDIIIRNKIGTNYMYNVLFLQTCRTTNNEKMGRGVK